jgi:hypothetical protein
VRFNAENGSETKFWPFPAIADGVTDQNGRQYAEREGNGRFPRL